MKPDTPYRSRPLNLGHRGAREVAPENTLASFRKALELGADGIELDVMLSRDKHMVVIHDYTVDRTTNGNGRVAQLSVAELKALDAGSWFGSSYSSERLPTLQEVVEELPTDTIINIELKGLSLLDRSLEEEVVRLIETRKLASRVIVSSFNPLSLRRVSQLNPAIETGLLYMQHMPLPLRRAWLAPFAHAKALHPEYTQVSPDYVHRMRQKGYHLNVWNAQEPDELQALIEAGADAVITDRPDRLRELLDEVSNRHETASSGPGNPGEPPASEGHPLVQLARGTIEKYVRDGEVISPPSELAPEMKPRAGVFVSLHKRGALRGCIGTIEPVQPNVAQEIIQNAISAATRDPRFPPVRPDELGELEISTDVLGEPEPITSLDELDPERYGVIVEKGYRRGLLLPNLEGVGTAEEQIDIALRKAWISEDEEYRILRFEVVRYH